MENTNKMLQSMAFEFFKGIRVNELEYIYRGHFSQKITDNILSLTEINLTKVEAASKIRKRIYYVLVEGLQNITRHQNKIQEALPNQIGIFAINKRDSKYYITTGNLIDNSSIESLTGKLDKINSLEKDQLKQYYLETLDQGSLSDKGGAGLGLIEMARKTGNKLNYDFRDIDGRYSFFYLHMEVPAFDDMDATETTSIKEDFSLEKIKDLHAVLNRENILLTFKGTFNQESLLNLLSIVEGQMKESSISIRVFNVMVEMLQNIVKHADQRVIDMSGSPGIFFINERDNEYWLTAGNYVINSKTEDLKKRFDYVNTLPLAEIDKHYNDLLTDTANDSTKHAGLGLLDMRIKSRRELIYSFEKLDDEFSFFTLQVVIRKKTFAKTFISKATADTPEIEFNPEHNTFKIGQRSITDDAFTFYQPVIEWLEQYVGHALEQTTFDFHFDRLNTHSAKQVAKIFLLLEKLSKEKQLTLNWHYKSIDEDMKHNGERFSKLVSFPINLVSVA